MPSEDVVQRGDGCSTSSEDGDGNTPVSHWRPTVGTLARMHTDVENMAES